MGNAVADSRRIAADSYRRHGLLALRTEATGLFLRCHHRHPDGRLDALGIPRSSVKVRIAPALHRCCSYYGLSAIRHLRPCCSSSHGCLVVATGETAPAGIDQYDCRHSEHHRCATRLLPLRLLSDKSRKHLLHRTARLFHHGESSGLLPTLPSALPLLSRADAHLQEPTC